MKLSGWRWARHVLPLALVAGVGGWAAANPLIAAPPGTQGFETFDRVLVEGDAVPASFVVPPHCVPAPPPPRPLPPGAAPQPIPPVPPYEEMPPQPSAPSDSVLPPPTPDQTLTPPEAPAAPEMPQTAPATFPQMAALDAGPGVLGASGRLPMMIGDFFGTGGGPATLINQVFVMRAIAATTNGQEFNGLLGVNTVTANATGPFFAGQLTGLPVGFPSLAQIGIDTNADGVLDSFPNLVAYPFQSDGNVVPVQMGDSTFTGTLTDDFLVVPVPGSGPGTSYRLFDIHEQEEVVVVVPTASSGGAGAVVGRTKIAENSSPIPRDRVFFNYSYFDNVPLTAGGVSVDRFTPGFEKTFLDGNASIEVRMPFATTLDSNVRVDGLTNTDNVEVGNLVVGLKAMLYSTEEWVWSAGLWVSTPTADDLNIYATDGTQLINVENQAVHLLPFVGALYAPTDRLFVQGFLQVDVDANGNSVSVTDFNNGLNEVGRVNDSTFLFASLGMGYFVYLDETDSRALRSIAPVMELHYNRSLQEADVVASNGFQVGTYADDIQVLDAVFGVNVQFRPGVTVTGGYVTPIGNGADQPFDGELRVLLNWYFGGSAGRQLPPL